MGLGDPSMDISGLTNSSASGSFPGYGGTASLPSLLQAKLAAQSQSLSLIPAISGPNLANLANIYDAVGKQTLGAFSGRSGIEITLLSMGIGDGQTSSALPGGSNPASSSQPPAASASGSSATGTSSPVRDPAIGATLDKLLKEAGYVAPDANPYVYRGDFFSDGSRGGLLDSRG
jgi:hypothetical protein